MNSYIICPERDSKKVDLTICLQKCELKSSCEKFRQVPKEILMETSKKLGIPITHLKEIEAIIEVETETGAAIVEEGMHPEKALLLKKDAEVEALIPSEVEKCNSIELNESDREREAVRLYEKALVIKRDIEIRFLEMGALLNEFDRQKYFKELGYGDLNQFCEEALGIKRTMAFYLKKIDQKKTELHLSDLECAEVGVTKLIQILPVMKDEKSASRWLREARKPRVTTERLNSQVRLARGRITEEEAARVPIKVFIPLYEAQKEIWDRAFGLAGKILGSDKRSVQAEMICAEFLSTYEQPDEEWPRARIVAAWLTMIERIQSDLRVRFNITVTDFDTGEIISEIR